MKYPLIKDQGKKSHFPNCQRWSIRLKTRDLLYIELFLLIIFLLNQRISTYHTDAHWQQYFLYGISSILGLFFFGSTFRSLSITEWGCIWVRYHLRHYRSAPLTKKIRICQNNDLAMLISSDSLSTVIELFAPTRTPVFVENGIAEYAPAALIPVEVLIASLRQYDVRVDSIDIINTGCKQSYRSGYDQVYSQLVPDSPAVGSRRTFVIIHLKPRSLRTAILRRGGGALGLGKTMNLVTQRSLRSLREEGIHAAILTYPQLSEAMSYLERNILERDIPKHDIPVQRNAREEFPEKMQEETVGKSSLRERWKYLENNRQEYISTYAINPQAWTRENQNSWWRTTSLETTHIIHLTSVEHMGRDTALMHAWIRYITPEPPATQLMETSGISLLYGQQSAATHLAQFSPIDASFIHGPGRLMSQQNQPCCIPIGASGQYLGRTLQKKHIYLDLFAKAGSQLAPRIILKNIDTAILQQIVLRALAVGAKIKIYSSNTSLWSRFIETNRSSHICLASDSSTDTAHLVIFDRMPTQHEPLSSTIISIDHPEHFPTNITINISPYQGNPTLLHIDLGDRTGLIQYISSLSENQYLTGEIKQHR